MNETGGHLKGVFFGVQCMEDAYLGTYVSFTIS